MLNSIRRRAGSWVVKALLLLLVASFAVWGIGDVFYGGGQNPAVATVGESEITSLELSEAFSQRLSNLQRRLGNPIDRDQAIELGVMQAALQDLIARRLIDLKARDMGLRISEDILLQRVTGDPMFQTAGRFDRSRFDQLLMANAMSEEGYLAALRQDMARQMLTGSLTGPASAPEPLVDALYRYRNEERSGRVLLVDPASVADVPEPTEEQLAAHLEENEERFTAPAYRRITLVTLTPEDLLEEVAVSEEDLEAAYQERIAQYRTPERRTVQQLMAQERDAIEQAAERIAAGAAFEAVAGEIEGVRAERFEALTRGELPAAVDEAVFALDEGEVGEPVESPFGWHLFRVSEVQPESTRPLDEVRDDLAEQLVQAEAGDRLPALANRLDDELAAGVPLGEAARTVGLEAESMEVDEQGLNPEGVRPEGLPSWPEIMSVVLETPAGETSLLEETADGSYFVVAVDEITPSRVRTLDEAREEVARSWRADQRAQRARERAEALLARAQETAAFDQIADEPGVSMQTIGPVQRDGEGGAEEPPDRALVRALFATEEGRVADEVVDAEDGFALVMTDEVIAADPLADAEAVERLREELEADIRSDLLVQLEAALRQDYPVEIHAAALNRVIGGQDGF